MATIYKAVLCSLGLRQMQSIHGTTRMGDDLFMRQTFLPASCTLVQLEVTKLCCGNLDDTAHHTKPTIGMHTVMARHYSAQPALGGPVNECQSAVHKLYGRLASMLTSITDPAATVNLCGAGIVFKCVV